ncbi:hypothetical protein N7540_000016 [Penicillium herquei]|nr:hypothetical protein N7540_000016 [Penicillium herquei]
MFRRNGKPTSCEPCRLSKVRCDHVTPVCGRCKSRDNPSQCYYHPAPLTKSHGQVGRPRPTRKRGVCPVAHTLKTPSQRSQRNEEPVLSASSLPKKTSGCPAGFLGSTSYISVFRETARVPRASDRSLHAEFEHWRTDPQFASARLIRLITAMPFYQEQIQWYYGKGRFTVIPAPTVLESLAQTVAYMESHSWDITNWVSIYNDLLAESEVPLDIYPTMSLRDFCSSFTGAKLRLEFIGFVFAMAGISVHGRYPSREQLDLGNGETTDTESFLKEMVLASHACIEASKHKTHVNDLTIWMRYMHVILGTEVLGETSMSSGGQESLFGDLTSCIYAMGLHQQHSLADVPFFLAETRKRMLAVSHRTDKNLSTLLGRPPRLPHRYCNVAWPLDLADDDLFQHDGNLDAALLRLDENGWNTEGKFYPATLIRIRDITSNLRERVLELSLGHSEQRDHANNLSETYKSCERIFDSIPSRYIYTPECWKETDSIECLARMIIQLEYLFSVLHLQRVRCQTSSEAINDLLDTCLQYQVHEVGKQFPWVFLVYGIPAAGVIVTELHRHTLSNQPLPSNKPRSEIIRTLSFLVSWVRDTTKESPPSVTMGACSELNNVIVRLLDDVLDYQPDSGQHTHERLDTQTMDHGFEKSTLSMGHGLPSESLTLGFGSGECLSWLDDLDLTLTSPGLLL